MKPVGSLAAAAFLAALWAAGISPGHAGTDLTVLELVGGGHAAYIEADGCLRQAILSGVPETRLVSISLVEDDGPGRARSALAAGPSLVVAIGSRAARLARESAPGVPLVYAMVLDPVSLGLPAPGGAPSGDATGVTIEVAPERQFELMREILPSARRIGVLYDPAISGDAVRRAAVAARTVGLTVVGQTVRSEGEVLGAASLLAPRVDALWALADPTVLTAANARALILFSLRARKPLFAVSEGFVRRGALAALVADPRGVGCRAGELAALILRGISPATLRAEPPPRASIFINRATAEHLGVNLPEAAVRRARTVFPQP